MNAAIPHETLTRIKESLFRGQKIDAIKLYRECTGAVLADAKAAVRDLEAELRAASPERFIAPARRQGDASLQTRRLGWAFLAAGTLSVLIGVGTGLSALSFSFGSARTEGTAIKLDRLYSRNDRTYYPVVEYQVDASKYTFRGVGSNAPHEPVGQKVQVLYKNDQPQVACIDSFFDRWLPPLMFSGVGALFAGIGAWVVRSSRLRTA